MKSYCDRSLLQMLAIGVLLCLNAVRATSPVSAADVERLTSEQHAQNLESFDYVWTTIRDKYFDSTLGGLDWDAVRAELHPRVAAADSLPEVRAILDDMISRLEVSHFSIIPAEAYENLRQAEKPLGGVTGIEARVIAGQALVTEVREASPAARAGVQTGWEITRIGEDEVGCKLRSLAEELQQHPHQRTMLTSALRSSLRGRVGETLLVGFRDGCDQEIRLKLPFAEPRGHKARFGHIPEFHIWIDVRTVDQDIGYIRFNAFMDPVHVMTTFNTAMRTYREAHGIIIDLRGNGGGMGEMGMGMMGWLLAEGRQQLGTVIFRDNQLNLFVHARPETYGGPVVVLIDEMSVSAAEFFASGMQDLGRAQLIGTRTAGAVLGSSIEKLPNGDGFQYAAANYISKETGESLEGIGVTPDMEVVPTRDTLLQGRDLALEAAIQWIRDQNECTPE